MNNINFISGIVKILETPKKKKINQNLCKIKINGELPLQKDNTIIVSLIFWDKLANNMEIFYKKDDYILIEGYLTVKNKNLNLFSKQTIKKFEITVIKIYPILLK